MTERFFLFVGGTVYEGPGSRLKASGIAYRLKRLESNPENWGRICELLEADGLVGAVVKLTSYTVGLMDLETYAESTERLFGGVARVPHLVLAHEAVLTGESGEPTPSVADDDLDEDWDYYARSVFGSTTDNQRASLMARARDAGVEILPYRTNAELSVLTTAFVEDNESNLLFRLYVPLGRLYAEEADRLLSLFRDWLSRVKGSNVRQDGYSTGSGRVYEFFADDEQAADLSIQFDAFSRFLDLCGEDVEEAVSSLESAGIPSPAAEELVGRYSKESRRLQLDLRHARETRLLSIKQRLEAEIIDLGEQPVDRLLEALIPPVHGAAHAMLPSAAPAPTPTMTVTINQQVIGHAEGIVAQSVAGNINLTPEATELLRIIAEHAEKDSDALTTAVYELEDEGARATDRLRAKQRLKGFLLRIAAKVEGAALQSLQTYLEKRMEM